MKRVTGIGGVFFKASDPKALGAWYRDRLGINVGDEGYTVFTWRESDNPSEEGSTVWSLFPADTEYFNPSQSPFMINYRVDDLDALLVALREEGVSVDDRVEEYEYGRFGWIIDPEGNRIELWEPPKSSEASAGVQ